MAKRHDVLGVTGADTVIGTGVKLRGTLHGEGDIAIDGHINGNIKATGSISIGINAELKSNIEALDVWVNGSLNGNITAEGKVALGEASHVVGNIACQSISIDPGAIFIGQIRMPEDHTNIASSEPPASSEEDDAETSES